MVSLPTLKSQIDSELATVASAHVSDPTHHVGLLNARRRTEDGDSDDAIQYPYFGYEGFARPNPNGIDGSHVTPSKILYANGVADAVEKELSYILRLDVGVFATSRAERDRRLADVRDHFAPFTRDAATLHADVSEVDTVSVDDASASDRNVAGVRDTYEIRFERTISEDVPAAETVNVTLRELADEDGDGKTTYASDTF